MLDLKFDVPDGDNSSNGESLKLWKFDGDLLAKFTRLQTKVVQVGFADEQHLAVTPAKALVTHKPTAFDGLDQSNGLQTPGFRLEMQRNDAIGFHNGTRIPT